MFKNRFWTFENEAFFWKEEKEEFGLTEDEFELQLIRGENFKNIFCFFESAEN